MTKCKKIKHKNKHYSRWRKEINNLIVSVHFNNSTKNMYPIYLVNVRISCNIKNQVFQLNLHKRNQLKHLLQCTHKWLSSHQAVQVPLVVHYNVQICSISVMHQFTNKIRSFYNHLKITLPYIHRCARVREISHYKNSYHQRDQHNPNVLKEHNNQHLSHQQEQPYNQYIMRSKNNNNNLQLRNSSAY